MPRCSLTRRHLLASGAAVVGAAVGDPGSALGGDARVGAARPPAGFLRLSLPGKVTCARRPGSLTANGAYPKADAARAMLEAALTELTGTRTLVAALGTLVSPSERIAIKPNGIAGRQSMKMAANVEVVAALAHGLVELGVPPQNITIFEQFRDFLFATRCITDKASLAPAPELPAGVRLAVHLNKDATMEAVLVGGVPTKYVTPFTDATAVINVTQIKDHSICGYTGALKNITHGCNTNPHDFHAHTASPQIAHLYAQDVVKSRVVLHIADAYQVIYDEGPIDVNPKRRVPHEALYASTDPVALDVVGWEIVERLRKENGLPTLSAARREPAYLRIAGELGLGIFERSGIALRELRV